MLPEPNSPPAVKPPLPEQALPELPLPEGMVTFLFSDVEGSTRLLEAHGAATTAALERHLDLIEQVVARYGGAVFETIGDAVYAAFARPPDAVQAAIAVHTAMAAEEWKDIGGRLACRIAVHTGSVEQRGRRYFGAPLFRCARLQALAHGEQTVVSGATAALVGGDLPEGASLIERGVHRLKDLQEPEHVFELRHVNLRTDFPPLRSLDAAAHNLPTQPSSFVGRREELDAVRHATKRQRLVTVLGPGGMGKTRLAIQAAADAFEAFPDGVWFVDLAPLRDAEKVPQAIAATLGIREEPDRPMPQTLTAHLRTKKVLLVLDNLEQLLPSAARTVSDLVAATQHLHVLATSRAPLRIRGEIEHELPPLPAGDPAAADAEVPGAVALFLERAQAIKPDLRLDDETGPLIASICRRLDGLPLAIELAASRLRLFSLDAIHERLGQRLPMLIGGARDLPERQQALRATIAWSEELLAEPERRLFHRLGAFARGFTLEGARAVAPDGDGEVEPRLTVLLEQSLVRRLEQADEPRYDLLETIREYTLEHLASAGELDATLDRIADHMLELARETDAELFGAGQSAGLRRFDTELSNFRSVLAWLRQRGDSRLPLLVASLARYWSMRGLSTDGGEWVEVARAIAGDEDDALCARLLGAEALLVSQASPARALARAEEAVSIYRRLGERRALAAALMALGDPQLSLKEHDAAERSQTEARDLAREVGDLRTEAAAVGNLATVELRRGNTEAAEEGLRAAADLFRKAGDLWAVVIALGNLGEMALLRGDVETSVEQHRLGVAAAERAGDPRLHGWELTNLALVMGLTGMWREAVPMAADGIEKLAAADDRLGLLEGFNIAGTLLRAGGDAYGAGLAWSLCSSLSRSLELYLETDGRYDDGIADVAARLGREYAAAQREAAGLSLEEAVAWSIDRLRALPN